MITKRLDLKLGSNKLSLSPTAKLLSVIGVREVARLYVSDDPKVEPTEVVVELQHTGADVPEGASYVGTAVLSAGELHAWRVEG